MEDAYSELVLFLSFHLGTDAEIVYEDALAKV